MSSILILLIISRLTNLASVRIVWVYNLLLKVIFYFYITKMNIYVVQTGVTSANVVQTGYL